MSMCLYSPATTTPGKGKFACTFGFPLKYMYMYL